MPAAANLGPPDDAVIVIRRTLDAPRELVFQAFTDPKHLVRFWGPKGFTNPACDVELRVGGAFRVEMRAPDGATYPCSGIYREIVPPERIVYAGTGDDVHPCGGGLPPHAEVTVTFVAEGRRTRLTIHTRLRSVADRDAAIKGGFESGWNDCVDRLEALLQAT